MDDLPVPVDLDRMDWEDATFAIRSFLSPHRLEASLDRYGILHPPWLLLTDTGRYVIVDGLKRLSWVRKTRKGTVKCVVFPATSDRKALMLRHVEAKIFGPPLNVAEKAQIISRLDGLVPRKLIVERYFPYLHVAGRPDSVAKWCRLAVMDESFLGAVASEQVSERGALELVGWDTNDRGEALRILTELRCSASIQMEILERLSEIAIACDEPRIAILGCSEVQGVLHQPGWSHRQKTQALRSLLTRLRFPRLSAREDQFTRDLAGASLPKGTRLIHPPAFEGESWQLLFSFSDLESLHDLLRKALDFAFSAEMRHLVIPSQSGKTKKRQS
jgi:ParB family transcriptional regulator, chromosome partitioning protein